jgi:hypothetical protein
MPWRKSATRETTFDIISRKSMPPASVPLFMGSNGFAGLPDGKLPPASGIPRPLGRRTAEYSRGHQMKDGSISVMS